MIAKWVAQALIKGDDHLTLSTEELAQWQANGCRVSLGAPWSLFGQYAQRQLFWWREALVQTLSSTNPNCWPVGQLEIEAQKNKKTVIMPSLEFDSADEGRWRVSLIPADVDHCLDSWSFDLYLTPEELVALTPLASRLAKRMLIRCEIKGAHNARDNIVLWNEGRLMLCELAGLDPDQLQAWFESRRLNNSTHARNAESAA